MSDILVVLLFQVLFERHHVSHRDRSKAFLQLIDLEVLLLSELDQVLPVLINHVDLILHILLYRVFVHLENAELFDNFRNLELHIH